jgi:predicted O-methyltransferase YrrM
MVRYALLFLIIVPMRLLVLGILGGGSTALIASLAPSADVIAIDGLNDRSGPLDAWVAQRRARVTAVFGVDQSDRDRLVEVAGGPLDLVFDDCSHRLEPTRASFEALFPLIRPGGAYVIEDWSHGVVPAADPALTERLRDLPRRPLVNLVAEMLLACATTPQLIAGIEVTPEAVVVHRGDTVPTPFSITDAYWSDVDVSIELR